MGCENWLYCKCISIKFSSLHDFLSTGTESISGNCLNDCIHISFSPRMPQIEPLMKRCWLYYRASLENKLNEVFSKMPHDKFIVTSPDSSNGDAKKAQWCHSLVLFLYLLISKYHRSPLMNTVTHAAWLPNSPILKTTILKWTRPNQQPSPDLPLLVDFLLTPPPAPNKHPHQKYSDLLCRRWFANSCIFY